MVRVGLYLRYCVDKVKQRVLFTMDVPETATVCRLLYTFKLLCSETAYLAYICSRDNELRRLYSEPLVIQKCQ